MVQPLPLKSIAAFHATARLGSVTKAADALGVSPSAVSQQIKSLEHYLATTLLVRQKRSVKLTEAGERYYDTLSPALDAVESATQSIRGYVAASVLTIRCAPSLATNLVLPRLHTFLASHPTLGVRLDATNEATDFGKDSVDIDIRYGRGEWPGLYVESLGEEAFIPVASPALVAPGSLRPRDLLTATLIHSVKAVVSWPQFFRIHDPAGEMPLPSAGLQFDRSYMSIDAAVRGLGIALESTFLAHDALASGALARCMANARPIAARAHWIVCPHGHLRLRRVNEFLGWLREVAAAPMAVASAAGPDGGERQRVG